MSNQVNQQKKCNNPKILTCQTLNQTYPWSIVMARYNEQSNLKQAYPRPAGDLPPPPRPPSLPPPRPPPRNIVDEKYLLVR